MTGGGTGVPQSPGVDTLPPPPRIVVVGAGIAGLAAALRIAEDAGPIHLVVCEGGARAGGVIATERGGERGEYLVEAGPDSFLTEKPEALRLCARLGLAGTLIGVREGAGRAYVVRRGRLVPIPDGFRLVAPTRLGPWLRSPLFSLAGKLRMAMDWVLPPGPAVPDESVASFVTRRLGREAFDYMAEPMIGTIYTADAEALSLAATMPRFAEIERCYGSVIRGLVRAQRAAGPRPAHAPSAGASRGPEPPETGRRLGLFATLSGGMQALVDAAVARLPAGVLRLRTPVAAVARGRHRYAVALAGGGTLDADAVIVAAGARTAARLLRDLNGDLASRLGAISYASSASVTLGYRRSEIRHPLDGFGFVVPRVERRPILAASFSSVKFAGRAPADRVLVRVFLGGATDPGALEMDDDRLAATVRREMEALVGAAAAPHFVRVMRHHDAMPQYAVGHLDGVAEIEAGLAALPGLALAGAAYRGVGVPDCIRSGETAAERVLEAIAGRTAADPARREARRPPG